MTKGVADPPAFLTRKCRIVSDGTAEGTHLYGPDGETIGAVREFEVSMHVNFKPELRLIVIDLGEEAGTVDLTGALAFPELDIEVDADKVKHKKIKI